MRTVTVGVVLLVALVVGWAMFRLPAGPDDPTATSTRET